MADYEAMVKDPGMISGLSEGTAAASMLAAEVSHELAKTLTFLRCLVNPDQPSDLAEAEANAAEVADFAGREAARIERVLNLLRRFKLGPPTLAEVALVEILNEIVEPLVANPANRGIAIAVEVPPQVRLRLDVMWLKEALVRLVQHAVGNAPAGSSVRIRAVETAAPVERAVLIEIEDSGPSLSCSKPAQLFDVWEVSSPDTPAFHRSAAHRLIRQLGGTIDYKRSDTRNVFLISLPTGLGAPR